MLHNQSSGTAGGFSTPRICHSTPIREILWGCAIVLAKFRKSSRDYGTCGARSILRRCSMTFYVMYCIRKINFWPMTHGDKSMHFYKPNMCWQQNAWDVYLIACWTLTRLRPNFEILPAWIFSWIFCLGCGGGRHLAGIRLCGFDFPSCLCAWPADLQFIGKNRCICRTLRSLTCGWPTTTASIGLEHRMLWDSLCLGGSSMQSFTNGIIDH